MNQDAGPISAQAAINPVMLSSEVRNAIGEVRPDDMNRLIRPARKLRRPGRAVFHRIRPIWSGIGNTNSSGS